MAVTITAVEKGSIAEKKRIHPGDRLVSVNGRPVIDVLDYRFFLAEERLTLELETTTEHCYERECHVETHHNGHCHHHHH